MELLITGTFYPYVHRDSIVVEVMPYVDLTKCKILIVAMYPIVIKFI